MSIDGKKTEVVARLLSIRHSLDDTDEASYAMVTDAIRFIRAWGTAPPPQQGPQFMQFTVNGQPVDPSQFARGQNQ